MDSDRILYPICLVLFCLLFNSAWAGPYSALVVDVESDRVLYAQNADELRHPASLTKMMTLYMVFDALNRGQLSLNDRMRASHFAVTRPPSKLGLRAGDTITVEEGILALVTQSANDAATVIAESLGGSEAAFAVQMTHKAHQLGMSSSVFYNASGLPNPDQITTARDMFKLGRALQRHFPQYYAYFSTDHFVFRNRSFHNHNHLLENYEGTDGIKTGYVNASGFNLVASAKRNGHRLIGVVFGGDTHARRDAHMRNILDDGFAQLEGQAPGIRFAGFGGPIYARASAALGSGDKRELRSDKKIQLHVGEFTSERAAKLRLSQLMKAQPYALRHAKPAVFVRTHHARKIYAAGFRSMNKGDADAVCQALRPKHLECEFASR